MVGNTIVLERYAPAIKYGDPKGRGLLWDCVIRSNTEPILLNNDSLGGMILVIKRKATRWDMLLANIWWWQFVSNKNIGWCCRLSRPML